MGAPRVTPQEIVEMHRLYAEFANYAAVGRILGRSGSTVAKYIKMKDVPQNVQVLIKNLAKDKN